MFNYYTNGTEVRIFEKDVDASEWIDLKEFKPLLGQALDKHLNPYNYLSEEEKMLLKRQQMPNLSKREFRKRLRDAGLFDTVSKFVEESGDGYLQDAWEYSDYYSRTDEVLLQAINALGMTDEQVDSLWEL